MGDGWGGGGGGSWPAGPNRRPVGPGPSNPCSPRRCGPPPPLASPCRRGVVRTRLIGGPPAAGAGRVVPSWCSRQDRHRAVGGRDAVSPPAVRCRTGWRPRWPARGAVPRGRAWAGDRLAVGPSPCVSPKCRPCALSCQPAALCEAGAAARALRAGGQVCLGLAAAGAVPHSHRGAPARPACRRGAAVGVAADMIPVHSDPPVFRRRAAMSQFPAAKDYPARATTPAPRRGGEATFGSFAKLTATGTRVYCDIDL